MANANFEICALCSQVPAATADHKQELLSIFAAATILGSFNCNARVAGFDVNLSV